MTGPMIAAQGLEKSYGDHAVLRDVDLTVRRGEIFALLGPNGAGKTTTVNILTTLVRPDGGTARVAGADVVHDAARVRETIALTGQYASVDEFQTGRENLVMMGELAHLPRRAVRPRAAALLERRDPDAVMGSFAADHVIRGSRVFEFAVRDAVEVAREGYICTIGITPSEPAVGFGYIKRGGELIVEGARDASLVERFVEKPDLETARAYVSDRSYLWNAGMFISRADVLLAEIEANSPELHAGLLELAEAWDDRDRRGPAVDRIWPKLKKIAIDYVVAEPAAEKGKLAVVPGHFDWDDVGDFASLAKLNSNGRKNDLAILGENARILSDAASGIVVSHTSRVISLIGVKDIVVVDTPDALLVTTSENAQRVKHVVDALKLTGRGDVL